MAEIIERTKYYEDCSEEIKKAIRDRVKIVKDNILMYEEMPVVTKYSFQLFGEEFDRLTENFDHFYLIINLIDVDPPDVKVRHFIKEFFSGFDKLRYVNAFTGKNFVINVSARFVLGKIPGKKFSVHKNYETALAAIEKYIKEI